MKRTVYSEKLFCYNVGKIELTFSGLGSNRCDHYYPLLTSWGRCFAWVLQDSRTSSESCQCPHEHSLANFKKEFRDHRAIDRYDPHVPQTDHGGGKEYLSVGGCQTEQNRSETDQK